MREVCPPCVAEIESIGRTIDLGATFSGYQKLNENVTNGKADNHEGIDWYRPVENPDKSKPLWGENQWPAIPGFKEKYQRWVEKMKNLGLIVMEAYVAARSSWPPLTTGCLEQDGYGARSDTGRMG